MDKFNCAHDCHRYVPRDNYSVFDVMMNPDDPLGAKLLEMYNAATDKAAFALIALATILGIWREYERSLPALPFDHQVATCIAPELLRQLSPRPAPAEDPPESVPPHEPATTPVHPPR